MPVKKTNYTVADHKKAFDLYYDLRSFHAVSRELEIDPHTVRRWAGGESTCSCPWHSWEALVREREQALDIRLGQIESGDFDPIAQEQALLDLSPSRQLTEERKVQLRPASRVMIRSDAERLTYLEYLWSKVFFHATGIVTDHAILVDESGVAFDDHIRQTYFERGLDPKNLDSCIKSLKELGEMIEDLRRNLGLRKGGTTDGQPASTDELINTSNVQKSLTLQELREFRDLAQTTPPEKMRLLLAGVKAEDEAEQKLAQVALPGAE